MEETISLRELSEALKKRIKMILFIAFSAALVSGLISYFLLTPVYETSTQLLVNQAKEDQQIYNPSEVQTNLQLINTYNVIIKSPAILDKVIENLDLSMTTSQLNGLITVQSEQDSQVVNVSVQHEDPTMAADIANEIAHVFETEIVNIMNVDNVSILAPAEVAEGMGPVKPQPLLNIAIALVVGLMAGVGLAFLLEYLDNTIKTEQDVEKMLDLPVLGSVTTIEAEARGKSVNFPERKADVRGEKVGS
ncbi:YveK family protein [Bacillus thermotolerans]|uniref:Tyrosine-protein kinase transmembrane modulator EpsC n=1 Tax=Bacillus thermotolerans TaxID=1221996 RepID=A0A0F5I6K0_BACTR|nr:Wzz/FepE/Etk N-terminal domain-containing protein [Bacillus thermotolerans]KKB40920.1 Tyrosine-protein kinase transmembrane modulator EpsC [Bacillus thermotolerans]